MTQVTNLRIGHDPDFAQPSTSQQEFKGASPAQLIAHLQVILRRKSVLALDVASFAARYKQALSRQAIEMRERTVQVLKTPSILIDGSPPRYERLGFYMDFSGWDDPSYSTEKHAQRWLDDLGNANREPPKSLGEAIDAAVELVAMRHFQFAGYARCARARRGGQRAGTGLFSGVRRDSKRGWFLRLAQDQKAAARTTPVRHWRNAGRRSRRYAMPSGPSWRRRIRPTKTSTTMGRCCCCSSRTIAIGRSRRPQHWSRRFRKQSQASSFTSGCVPRHRRGSRSRS